MPPLGRPIPGSPVAHLAGLAFTARGSLPWTLNAQSYNSGTAHNGDFRRPVTRSVCGDLQIGAVQFGIC
jgi:hypothetical protein